MSISAVPTRHSVPRGYSATAPSAALQPLRSLSGGDIGHTRTPIGRPVGSNEPRANLMAMPPGPGFATGIYDRSYDSASVSPTPGQLDEQLPDAGDSPVPGTPGPSQAPLSSAGLQAQKRAYRQRRKDPSCDACRERKVKVNRPGSRGAARHRLAHRCSSAMPQIRRAVRNV